MPLLLETLYKWSGDEDVFETVEAIALSEDVKNYYTQRNGIGQRAWEIHLKGKIIREGTGEDEESAMYLLEFMEKLRRRFSYDTLEYIQYQAAFVVLQKHNKTVLSSLVNKFEEELRKNEQVLDQDNEHNDKLIRMIGYLRGALQEKALREKASQAL